MFANDTQNEAQKEDYWVSAADLLGGALVIFFLLMLYFMMTEKESQRARTEVWAETIHSLEQKLEGEKLAVDALQKKLLGAQVNVDSVKEVAVLYDKKRDELYHELLQEFGQDLPRWNAEIEEDLTVRFNEPSVLFEVGSARLRRPFIEVLDDFFPRYMALITREDFRDSVAELRIEGHTSSFWNRDNPEPPQQAWLKNMDLSFERSRSVLRFVMELPKVESELPWLRKHLTANGLSSAKLILDENGEEDWARSQRVEFRVRTDVESKIARILEVGG